MIINVINRKSRIDRKIAVTQQLEAEGCSYRFWDGVEGPQPIKNIHRAFKNVVQAYKNQGTEPVCIAEDDLVWTAPGAWKYFLENMPSDFDIYTGSYYSGEHDENFVVKKFRGNTLIVVAKRFYDKFLWLPENHHLDAALCISGAKIVVCPKFVCFQIPGYSDQRRRKVDDNDRLKGKILFGASEIKV